jgi:glycosyltransferase involved in cell wall biosynthesis
MEEHNEHQIFKPDKIPYQEISAPAVLSKKPLVSVKMITYNHEPYIAQAIEGVLIMQETDFPIELVIGEDCSNDRTRDIVLDYQKKYPEIIRVITSDKNVGANKNSKRTFKACRGKYLAFCEGDDYWHHPQKLQKQVDYLEAHPEVGLVHSDVKWHNVKTGKTIPAYYKKRKLSHNHENVLRSMIELEYHVMTCSAVVRKKLLDEIHKTCQFEFSESFMMGDAQTWIEIAYRSKVKYIDEPLATYDELPESACRSKDIEKRIRFIKNSAYMLLHYANKYGGNDSMEISKRIIRRRNKGLLGLACRTCKPDLSQEVLGYARKYRVSLDLMSYLYFIGSHNIFLSYLVRILTLPMRIVWKHLELRFHGFSKI